ncbi:hypothetical protein C8J27_103269 [Rhodobacter aestuarii]|uniref:Uncharacterized protein n=1 Tax=Rhodobacter aestuarii TaxID=453582 RepID=A0A1N7JY52_9RHOB|nr:hypothetical protein [Rhodobacter aestuarii]PTV95938.1 hypothetical protein C8J27_103269 [Rhodobacter aestuarii]SIS54257.1 hypothetical protein SAMN05421580_102165 [Rhodobacter aestuarii]
MPCNTPTFPLFLTALLLALAACGGPQSSPYPALVPSETLLIEEPLSPSPAPELEARAAALKARAAALRSATP